MPGPKKKHSEYASTRLEMSLWQAVTRLASEENRTISAMLRILIAEAIEKRSANGR
jgi:hypothetical protein